MNQSQVELDADLCRSLAAAGIEHVKIGVFDGDGKLVDIVQRQLNLRLKDDVLAKVTASPVASGVRSRGGPLRPFARPDALPVGFREERP